MHVFICDLNGPGPGPFRSQIKTCIWFIDRHHCWRPWVTYTYVSTFSIYKLPVACNSWLAWSNTIWRCGSFLACALLLKCALCLCVALNLMVTDFRVDILCQATKLCQLRALMLDWLKCCHHLKFNCSMSCNVLRFDSPALLISTLWLV